MAMRNSKAKLKNLLRLPLLAALLFILVASSLSNLSFSQVSGTAYCNSLFNPAGGTSYSLFNYPTSLNYMLWLSVLAMTIMIMVAGITYAIGTAFKLDKLVRFSKAEIGEIFITAIIVFAIIGTFKLASSVSPTSPPTSALTSTSFFSDSAFVNSCTSAANVSIGEMPSALGLMLQNSIISFFRSLRISIEPNHFGVAFSPFAGFSLISSVIGIMVDLAWSFVLLMAGVAMFLFIIYSFFPIFFFAGVVLRTIPWTRAAGGAFLGIFIGFFIVFPLLMEFALNIGANTIFQSSCALSAGTSLGSCLQSQTTLTSTTFDSFTSVISAPADVVDGSHLIGMFVADVISPAIYSIIGTIISILITIDFSETMGDFLGAPSLRSADVLRKLI
ncbi:MAG: hypothetical protein ACP5UC_01335 [Candidatus Micrarchaeia archaeon]